MGTEHPIIKPEENKTLLNYESNANGLIKLLFKYSYGEWFLRLTFQIYKNRPLFFSKEMLFLSFFDREWMRLGVEDIIVQRDNVVVRV